MVFQKSLNIVKLPNKSSDLVSAPSFVILDYKPTLSSLLKKTYKSQVTNAKCFVYLYSILIEL